MSETAIVKPDDVAERPHKKFQTLFKIYLYLLFAGTLLLVLRSLLVLPWHDWDIDAFLYLGSRLKHGELLYLNDFETKLPLVQYLFAVASELGGAGAWKIIAFLTTALLTAFSARMIASDFLRRTRWTNLSQNELTLFIFSFCLFSMLGLPGAESAHIETISTSAAFLACALLMTRKDKANNRLLLSGVLLAFAALIRPNFIYLVPGMALLILIDNSDAAPLKQRLQSLLVFCMGFTLLLVATFVPYLFPTNGLSALVDGLGAIAAFDSKNIGFHHLLHAQLTKQKTMLFYVSVYGANLIAIGYLMFGRRHFADGLWKYLFLSLCSVLLLNLSLAATHYYGHHSMMFAPFLLLPILALLTLHNRRGRGGLNFLFAPTLLFAFLWPVYVAYQIPSSLYSERHQINANINHRRINDRLLSFLASEKAERKSFLVVESPIYHMLLDEPRIGDGHPILLQQILTKQKIGPVNDIKLFSNDVHHNPCSAIFESQKDILVVLNRKGIIGKSVLECLNEAQSPYRKIDIPKMNHYSVYVRGNEMMVELCGIEPQSKNR